MACSAVRGLRLRLHRKRYNLRPLFCCWPAADLLPLACCRWPAAVGVLPLACFCCHCCCRPAAAVTAAAAAAAAAAVSLLLQLACCCSSNQC